MEEYKHIKPTNYITIIGDMIIDLKLKGNELIVYALIHGFCQDKESRFSGSLSYLQEFTSLSKQGVLNVLESLQNKGLIAKEQKEKNGVTTNYYKTLDPVKKVDPPVKKVDYPLSNNLTPDNNIYINNNKKEKDSKEKSLVFPYHSETFMQIWNELLTIGKWKSKKQSQLQLSLNKLSKVSEEDAIKALQDTLENGWVGVFPKVSYHPQKPQNEAKNEPWKAMGMTEEQYKSNFGK